MSRLQRPLYPLLLLLWCTHAVLGGTARICVFCGACDIAKVVRFHLLQSTPDFIDLTMVVSNGKGTIIQSKNAEISQKLETEIRNTHIQATKNAFF
jgi:hypothetical protein